MKKILLIFALVLGIISLSSCGTAAYAATYETEQFGEITYTTVITYGDPVYYDGLLSHYVYRGVYYYPYMFDGLWCVHPFMAVQPRGFIFRPYYGFRPEHRFIAHRGGPRPAFRHHRNGYSFGHGRPAGTHRNFNYGRPGLREHMPSSSTMSKFGYSVPARPNGNANNGFHGRSSVQNHGGVVRGQGRSGSAGRR